MASTFLEQLRARPLLGDGAMGTLLFLRGAPYDACLDELTISRPELVQAVHRDYIAAGAEVLETNTFGANRIKLERHGLGERVVDLNRRAVRLAREAREISGRDVWVAGSVGPLGKASDGPTGLTPARMEGLFREQVEGLLEGGADLLVIETFWDMDQALAAIRAARAACSLPLVAQMTFTEELTTLRDMTPEDVARLLEDAGADVIGANCSVGPHGILEVLERMASVTQLPLSAQPNAGLPRIMDGRVVYIASPDYFAEYAVRFVEAGARLIGGCCGTTPAHVAAMRRTLDEKHPEARRGHPAVTVVEAAPEPEAGEPTAGESFADKLGRHFVVSVELDPPRGLNPARLIQAAHLMREEGVDAVNIADSPMARVRMSALALAYLIQSRVGIETILHFTCRDRNLMGLQSDLIGAHAAGIRNILALTGDPPSVGDYAQATAVFDVDSVGLLGIIRRMNDGFDVNGTSIGSKARFRLGCAVNPACEDLDGEIVRFRRKMDAGAEFAMTQPLYQLSDWLRFRDRLGEVRIPILMGVLPLHSSRHAEFLHHEVPGISVPDSVRARMGAAGADGLAEGARLATSLLLEARGALDGVYLMPSFGRYEQIVDVVRAARQGAA
ncbi:MAG: bifunctional homocysteine S-methyltransferase/methylenetetrahydrofolate reductase [Candidatus Eisenbacteria bacterium]|nr:bifunctional homocysteine S-methyltransferase/methylenetetrahydrofolate reductase [Candidatus Eisenbacteria bacterium]